MLKRLICLTVLLLTANLAPAQRIVRTINESWQFHKGDAAGSETCGDSLLWETVSLPHTWNGNDTTDETVGYYRGTGSYKRTLTVNDPLDGRRFFLHFEGANQRTEVFVNGHRAGEHLGGYTAFCFDVTAYLRAGHNTLWVKVDNSYDPQIPPLSADFTFFGGIYRDVSLIVTSPIHISTTHYATSGVYISTPEVTEKQAVVEIRTMLTNSSPSSAAVMLEHSLVAPDGSIAAVRSERVKLNAGCEDHAHAVTLKISNPRLWDLDSPQLYCVYTRLTDTSGRELDCVSNPMGVRWFEFDPDQGFSLNGRYRKLMGTNRHQDYYRQGNALRDEMHVRDVRLLKEMGGNFLRIAHYPQDPVVLQTCDREGIVTSVEIPVVNAVTMSQEFSDRCEKMAREMVYQSFNSPSVVMWAYMNEVMLRPPYDKNDEAAKRTYMDWVYKIAARIESTLHRTDPGRSTMLPCHGNPDLYAECGIASLPHILGWNLYHGWYSNGFEGFPRTLDKIHAMFPRQSILVTEYGADVDPRLHSFDSERFDFTCEFGLRYHRYYIPEILKRRWLSGTTIWNLNDFYSEARSDAVPNVNNKGITGIDREKKDSYFLYQATLSRTPILRIGGHTWKIRGGTADASGCCPQPVEVYTNAQEVELLHNGVSLGTRPVDQATASFTVPFTDGENLLEARAVKDGQTLCDLIRPQFRLIAADLKDPAHPFRELNVMLGSKRYFEDRTAEMIWIPEQPYRSGNWGYVGGEAARTRTRYGSLPCSDIDVLGTGDDPVFQTQRRGIEEFRADVPDGQYYVYLYWAELVSGKQRAALAYNLGNDRVGETASERIFDVEIGGHPVLTAFDPARECGEERAVIRKFTVTVRDGKGLCIGFKPRKGEPILNAVRIYRCF